MRICPKLVAAKIERFLLAAPSAQNPGIPVTKLKEILWFIQALSVPHRGLEALVQALLTRYADRFGTKAMAEAGPARGGKYTLEQCLGIWSDIGENLGSGRYREVLQVRMQTLMERSISVMNGIATPSIVGDGGSGSPTDFEEWLAMNVHPALSVSQVQRGEDCDKAKVMRGYELFNRDFLHSLCLNRAAEDLPGRLLDLCTIQFSDFRPPWYCSDLLAILSDYMEAYAAKVEATIAETEVTKIVFRELKFAWSQGVPVPIVGESRIGKTSPAAVWCGMRPGRARLVTVPESNRERDFLEAHADAFGLEYTDATPTTKLRTEVKFIMRLSGLFTVYDEAQFLVPLSYNKTTPPSRLNFVRCQVIDKNLSCAFFATPQSYHQTLQRYVDTTGYRIEQWLGRIAPTVILPPDLSSRDLVAIAKAHFPDLSEPFLKLIAGRAMTTEGYIKSVELTAKRARFLAEERGSSKVDLEDVKLAIAYIMPGAELAGPGATRGKASATPSPAERDASASKSQEPDKDASPARRVNADAFMGPKRLALAEERERAANLTPA